MVSRTAMQATESTKLNHKWDIRMLTATSPQPT